MTPVPRFKNYELAGFPEMSSPIEMPSIEEILYLPMFQIADIDMVYKEGGETYRRLLDQAPIKGDRKYIGVWGYLQFLRPNAVSISYDSRWHIDSNKTAFGSEEEDRYHLIVTDCTALTEFNTNPITLTVNEEIFNMPKMDQYIGNNADILGFEPKKIEPNRFVTFTPHHVHRAIEPSVPEFRFALRIVESNHYIPIVPEKARTIESRIHKNGNSCISIEKNPVNKSIIVHTKED